MQSGQRGISWLTLFASTGTLVCCALPILLVTLTSAGARAQVNGETWYKWWLDPTGDCP